MWEHNNDTYLTRKEAAEFLGIKVPTLNAWAKKTHPRYIPFILMGKSSMYKLEDLEEFLRRRMKK